MRLTLATIVTLFAASSPGFPSCLDIPGNLVPACGFETAEEVEQWSMLVGESSLCSDPVRSGIGAVRLESAYDDRYRASIVMPDFPMSPTGPLTFHAYALAVDGSSAPTCIMWAMVCEVPPPPVSPDWCDIAVGLPTLVEPGGDWAVVAAIRTLNPYSRLDYGRVGVSCTAFSPFTVILDDVFFGEDPEVVVVFVDGFDSGDTSAWASPAAALQTAH